MKKTLILLSFLLFNVKLFSQCNPDITTGLIAKWDFSGNAADSSGFANNGTVHNANLTTDRCGNDSSAFSFFGSNQYINVPDAPSLRLNNTDYSISLWINKWDTTVNTNYSIIAKRVANNQTGYHLGITGGSSSSCPTVNMIFSGGGASDPFYNLDSVIALNSWQHIVVTYAISTTTLSLYIDNVLRGTSASIPTPNGTVSPTLRIGNDTWVLGPYGFNGKVDDIRFFNRVISTCDIDSLYHTICNVSPPPPSLCTTTNIKESTDPVFKVYPNPNNGYFKILFEQLPKSGTKFTIKNIMGQELHQTNIINRETEIQLKEPKGIYFLIISNEKEEHITKIILH